jgi:peptidylprolyl isomerase
MYRAKKGDTVKIHISGALEDGKVFVSSEGRMPLEFTIGDGLILPGIEQAILGMSPGETRYEKIPASQAYGQRREDMVANVDRNQLPDNIEPKIGQPVEMVFKDGNKISAKVTRVSDSQVTLDANHPLAGMDVLFRINLVEIL